jgi:hypothetical protein
LAFFGTVLFHSRALEDGWVRNGPGIHIDHNPCEGVGVEAFGVLNGDDHIGTNLDDGSVFI